MVWEELLKMWKANGQMEERQNAMAEADLELCQNPWSIPLPTAAQQPTTVPSNMPILVSKAEKNNKRFEKLLLPSWEKKQ